MCFFDKYNSLCLERGKSANAVAKEIGVSSGAITWWKKSGSVPRSGTLKIIAEYFHISIDELMDGVDIEKEPAPEGELVNNDAELTEIMQRVRDDPHMRMLFSITKDATVEDLEKTIKIIQALRG